MTRKVLMGTLGWGVLLWLVGYLLGIVLFALVPHQLIGWVIMPIGIVLTLLILEKKIKNKALTYYFLLAVSWTLIAIIFDYFFLVKLFKPADGYYKVDVYLYYALTFFLPIAIGWKKSKS